MEKRPLKRIEGLRKKLNKFGYTRNLIDSESMALAEHIIHTENCSTLYTDIKRYNSYFPY